MRIEKKVKSVQTHHDWIARRDLLKGAAVVAGISAAATLLPTGAAKSSTSTSTGTGTCNTLIIASDQNAIVETTAAE